MARLNNVGQEKSKTMFSTSEMYGLDNRDANSEIAERYNAMVNALSVLLNCGRWDVEALFDSRNNIDTSEIIKDSIKDGCFPSWNDIYRAALFNFAKDHNLEIGRDVDIYANSISGTDLYVAEDLDPNIRKELEEMFNMEAYEMEAPSAEKE